jgi:hypothetical protein
LNWSERLINWAAHFIRMGHRLKKLSLPVLTYFGALIIRTKIDGSTSSNLPKISFKIPIDAVFLEKILLLSPLC